MKLTFLGAARQVTGSCYLLEGQGLKILVDCGMAQGPDLFEEQVLSVYPPEIDYVLLTHAHIDHSGLLPLLYKKGFKGTVHTTSATRKLCDIMLKDAGHIQEMEAEWQNRKAQRSNEDLVQPLYTMEDAENVMKQFKSHEYNEVFYLNDNIRIRFYDAGHILGSAHIEISYMEKDREQVIVFSGDIGNSDKPMINDPSIIRKADYVVIESTYGDRDHEQKIDPVATLANVLRETFAKGGNVVIPSFAVGRAQELLYFLREIKERQLVKQFPNFKVYLDSPLSIEATNIFHDMGKMYYDDEAQELLSKGINPISFPDLKLSVTSDDSKLINLEKDPCVIISASGMCEAGRIRHHLKYNLWKENATILFVGYQVTGTLGFALLNGAKKVKLFQEDIAVNAKMMTLSNSSAHADRSQLISWISNLETAPRKVFVTHGIERASEMLAAKIESECEFNAICPYYGEQYDLDSGFQTKGKIERIRTATSSKNDAPVNNVFKRLIDAFKRLQNIVMKMEKRPNKEIERMTNQINELSNKWDK